MLTLSCPFISDTSETENYFKLKSTPFISDTSETENDFRLKSSPSAMISVKQKMTSD